MIFGYLILLVAVIISAIAAYYSVVGLTAIFAAAVLPVMIMGGALEAGKIMATVWLHNNWQRAGIWFKLYLIPAIVFLMLLTSMGIFGFLSKAHSDQSLVSGDSQAKLAIYDEKIKTSRDNIETNRKALQQMDAAVDQIMGRSSDEKGADKAVATRRAQQKERARLLAEITAEQKTIASLNEEAAPIRAENRKIEAEVGPIKYIAALIYGDSPDQNLLEAAVRWVIILIVIVFDPLALTLILAGNKQLEWARQGQGGWVHDQDSKTSESPTPPVVPVAVPEAETPQPVEPEPVNEEKELEEFLWRGKMIAKALDAEEAERLANEANDKLSDIEPDIDIDAIIEQAKEAEQREAQLQHQIVEQKEYLDALADEFVTLESRVTQAENAKAELEAQLLQAEQVKADIKTAFDATTAAKDTLSQEKSVLETQLQMTNNDVARLRIALDNKQLEIASLQSSVDTLQNDLQAAVALAQDRNQRLNEALAQIPPPQVLVEEVQEPVTVVEPVEVAAVPEAPVVLDDPALGYEQKYFTKYSAPASDSTDDAGDAGFGSSFPATPGKGDLFLRVDYLPSRLYKYNGSKWIEVDKDSNNRLAYNSAYIEHLIQKIHTGEYDIDDLNEAEKTEMEQYLRNNNAIL
jgi:hypothetical protein